MGNYTEFLATKRPVVASSGRTVSDDDINPILFPFQRDLTRWAVRKGRAAIFADTGLGKTFMQVEWARLTSERTLIVAPLSIARQTVREAAKFGVEVTYSRDGTAYGITITNYEMLDHFDPGDYGAIVLDESSILKAMDGKTRQKLTDFAAAIPYRLCCTATPAPNDITEIANHAEFLGVMSRAEMLSAFFVHDTDESARGGWRLKGHAEQPFYRWLASWGMSVRKPSDLGYSDEGYNLPPLNIEPRWVEADYRPEGSLFHMGLHGIGDRAKVRKATAAKRVDSTVELIVKSFNADTRTETRLHAEILQGASREVAADAGAESQGKCSPAGIVFTGRTSTDSGEDTGVSVASSESRQTQGVSTQVIRAHIGSVPGHDGETESLLRDLRTERSDATQHLSASGSLPRNGQGAGLTLPELQSWVRQVQGQPEPTSECYRLPKWIVWCGLNAEQDAIAEALGDLCISVYGSLSAEEKLRREVLWREGPIPVIVTKASVFGFGMNWQHCSQMAFVGLSDSWEAYYQCIRRSWRFGQTQPVDAFIVLSDAEEDIYQNVMRKEEEANLMRQRLIEHSREYERAELADLGDGNYEYQTDTRDSESWRAMLGDSCERMAEIADASVDLSVFSPPFLSLFTYSPTERDIGNSHGEEEFYAHFGVIIDELLRITKPGRIACCHVQQVASMLLGDGVIGVKDFRGGCIRAFEAHGWVYHGEVCIDKNPQAQAIRTHSKGLLFNQHRKDSTWSRPALADYICLFRKPGDNLVPVQPETTNDEWIEWAHPIWYGIRESETLNAAEGRDDKDEKHIAALQLGTIERCVRLWSNKGEVVFSPFMGIGSEGYVAVKHGRRFVGIELKKSYFDAAVRNLGRAEEKRDEAAPMTCPRCNGSFILDRDEYGADLACLNCGYRRPLNPAVVPLDLPQAYLPPGLRTHCVNGHEFTPENTRIRPNGHRACKACHRAVVGRSRGGAE